MKPSLKVCFSDFWFGFNPEDNFFTNLLRQRFHVTIDSKADLLICSVFGDQWRNFPGKRLFFTGEFIPTNAEFFDFSFSFAPTSATNHYLPLYRVYGNYPSLFVPRSINEAAWRTKKSVATVFSNRSCAFRNWTFHRLDQDIGVGSGGKAFNNVGGPVPDKRAFLSGYLFSLAFENASWPLYTTEKVAEAYTAQTVPIYWGDPLATEVFNPKAFLSLRGKDDYSEVVRKIREAVAEFEVYRSLFEAPLFPNNREPEFLRDDSLADFLEKVVAAAPRTKQAKVTNLALHRWRTWWRFREWGETRLFWIRFLQAFSWVGYLAQQVKAGCKRVLQR